MKFNQSLAARCTAALILVSGAAFASGPPGGGGTGGGGTPAACTPIQSVNAVPGYMFGKTAAVWTTFSLKTCGVGVSYLTTVTVTNLDLGVVESTGYCTKPMPWHDADASER